MFKFIETPLLGCLEIQSIVHEDLRGSFVKFFHADFFKALGLPNCFSEDYFSNSKKDVIRGMHFQTPPFDHEKLVFPLSGEIFDVAVDLRKSSPTFGKSFTTILNASKGNALYLPKGFAHGFCSLSNESIVGYKVTSVYNATHDQGIRWDSIDVDWPTRNPIISERDTSFVSLADFSKSSPFV